MMWLKDFLSGGPVAANEVLSAGKKYGFSKSTLHRAKDRLGIKSTKVGFSTGWGWFLPEESGEDPSEGPRQLWLGPSGKKITQVIDSIEDPTKVPYVQNKGAFGTFADHEDSKGLGPSDKPLTSKVLGGVQNTKIPCPTVLGSTDDVGTFDEDEVVI